MSRGTDTEVIPSHCPLPTPCDVTHVHGKPVSEFCDAVRDTAVKLATENRTALLRMTLILGGAVAIAAIVATTIIMSKLDTTNGYLRQIYEHQEEHCK